VRDDLVRIVKHEHVVGADSHDDEEGEEVEDGDVVDSDDVLVDPQGYGDGRGDSEHAEERDDEGLGVQPHEEEDGDEREAGQLGVVENSSVDLPVEQVPAVVVQHSGRAHTHV